MELVLFYGRPSNCLNKCLSQKELILNECLRSSKAWLFPPFLGTELVLTFQTSCVPKRRTTTIDRTNVWLSSRQTSIVCLLDINTLANHVGYDCFYELTFLGRLPLGSSVRLIVMVPLLGILLLGWPCFWKWHTVGVFLFCIHGMSAY